MAIFGNGLKILPVTPDHTKLLSVLPFPHGDLHRDPFDRLLVSQAMAENMNLVTDDERLVAYGVSVLW